jgi:hypothetical protein
MVRIFFLIALISIAIAAPAQHTQPGGLPPVRTSDKSPIQTKTAAVLPVKSGGNKSQTVAAQTAPLKKGGAGKSSGQSAANNAKTAQGKTTQSKTLQLPSALPSGKAQQQPPPSVVPVRQ